MAKSKKQRRERSKTDRQKHRYVYLLIALLTKLRRNYRKKVFGQHKRYKAIKQLEPLVPSIRKGRLEYAKPPEKDIRLPPLPERTADKEESYELER